MLLQKVLGEGERRRTKHIVIEKRIAGFSKRKDQMGHARMSSRTLLSKHQLLKKVLVKAPIRCVQEGCQLGVVRGLFVGDHAIQGLHCIRTLESERPKHLPW